jgi:hypothetical protein
MAETSKVLLFNRNRSEPTQSETGTVNAGQLARELKTAGRTPPITRRAKIPVSYSTRYSTRYLLYARTEGHKFARTSLPNWQAHFCPGFSQKHAGKAIVGHIVWQWWDIRYQKQSLPPLSLAKKQSMSLDYQLCVDTNPKTTFLLSISSKKTSYSLYITRIEWGKDINSVCGRRSASIKNPSCCFRFFDILRIRECISSSERNAKDSYPL